VDAGDGPFQPVRVRAGIALYACDARDGYWIATDQSHEANTCHVFDPAHAGAPRRVPRDTVRNTDGVALT
jgi:hypothetical protein